MQAKLTIIRDPIHNYIPISHVEEEKLLIDDPMFQRLRYVTQNGLAYSVYPSNRTSRSNPQPGRHARRRADVSVRYREHLRVYSEGDLGCGTPDHRKQDKQHLCKLRGGH